MSAEYDEIKRRKNAGIPFQAHFTGGTGNPLYHLFPGLVGMSRDANTGALEERVLCYKYQGNNGQGWRCFSPTKFTGIHDTNVVPPHIPPIDRARQNCVQAIDDSTCD
jgi:hypothetical protein